jgi:hypothetical protein
MKAPKPNEMVPGKHYFDGEFASNPCASDHYQSYETFSVGIFQAMKKSRGKECKRGPVKYRVRGSYRKYQEVIARAAKICHLMNRCEWTKTTKSEEIK